MRSIPRGARAAAATAVAAGLAVATVTATRTWACNPDYLPICGRTAYVAKFVNSVAVNPATPAAVTVPVGIVPRVEWNSQGSFCAQPTTHALELTVVCVEQSGGPSVTIGPLAVAMQDPRPTVPGNQPIAGGSPFPLVLPAGSLATGGNYVCTVNGRYTVAFGPGRGGGTIIGTGPTSFSVGPASPADANRPLLCAFVADPDVDGRIVVGAPGHEARRTIVVSNNHPTAGAYVTVRSQSRAASNRPEADPGSTEGNEFALSAQGERFPGGSADALDPERILPRPDPFDTTAGGFSDRFSLGAFESRAFTRSESSHGACRNGACAETDVTFDAVYPGEGPGGGDLPVVARIGTALQVDRSAPPCNALTCIRQTVASTTRADTIWSPGTFDNHLGSQTHNAGNFPLNIGGDGLRILATDFASAIGEMPGFYPSSEESFICLSRAEGIVPKFFDQKMVAFLPNDAFNAILTRGMVFELEDIPANGGTLVTPLVTLRNAGSVSEVRCRYKWGGSPDPLVDIFEVPQEGRERKVYGGRWSGVAADPALRVYPEVFSRMEVIVPDPMKARLEVRPCAVALDLPATGGATFPGVFTVVDGRSITAQTPVALTFEHPLSGPSTVALGEPFDVTVLDDAGIPTAPDRPAVFRIGITSPQALKPLDVPVAVRRNPAPPPAPLVIDFTQIDMNLRSAGKDTLNIRGRLPIGDGHLFDGHHCVDVGGTDFGFDAVGGKFAPAPWVVRFPGDSQSVAKLKIRARKRRGAVFAQDAALTLTVKKANFRGTLFDEGLRNRDAKGEVREILVRFLSDGKVRSVRMRVKVDSKFRRRLRAKRVP